MGVLRESYVRVLPDTDGFDGELKRQLRRVDPGGKAGKEIGGRLNAALRKVDLAVIDVNADPKKALAAITATEERLKELGRGAATVEVKVRTERALGELRRFRKSLGDVGGESGAEAASGFAARFSARLGPVLTSMPLSGPAVAAGGLLGAALAPSIGAGIGAGLAAGAGAVGIGAGLAIVAQDLLVKAAAKDMGTRFAAGVSAEAQAFRTPILGALKQIDAAATRTVPKIGQIFRNTAPSVDGLTSSLIRAGEAITDSLVDASGRSAGPLAALGGLVEGVGTEFGHMIDVLSKDGPAGTSAINDLTNAATNFIRTTTGIAHGLAVVKSGLDSGDKAWDGWRTKLEDALSIGNHAGAQFDITADGLSNIERRARDAGGGIAAASQATHQFIVDTAKADPPTKALAVTLNTAERAALGERNALVALSNQLRAQADPVFGLITAQQGLKTAQDNSAAAIKKHGRNSEESKTATRALALAAIDLQAKAGALGATFSGKLSPSMIATYRAGGLTEAQIKDIAREFRDAKRDGDKYAKRYQADARLTGGPGVSTKLKILGEMQAALASGNKPASFYGNLNRALLGARLAEGGSVPGSSPHKRADNIPAMLTAREWVQPVDSVDYYGADVMKAIQHRQIPAADLKAIAAFAGGGQVWPYRVTASNTRIPSKAEAASAVRPAFTGGGQSLDFIVRAVHSRFPGMRLISGYRPGATTLSGNRSYHALRRAADWPASYDLAKWWNANYKAQTKEFISPWNSLNIHNGQRHAYSGAIYRQHSGGNAHDHIAMAGGGQVPFASYDSGGFLPPGISVAHNGTGRPEPVGGGDTYVFNISGPVASKRAAKTMVLEAISELKSERKL